MGFRIDKGVFQFKDGDRFINKFKIDEAGTMVEVDPETGDPVAAYMRVGDKATDSDLLDGINSSSFLRNAGGTYTLGSGVHFSLKHTTSTGYSEMSLANNSNHRLVMGSIGSGYTNSAWAGSRYIYSTDGELRIKAATQLRLYSGGMSHTGNLAVTFDTSQNATFEGNTYFKGVLGNDLRINRHIDGSRGWSGGSAEMFLGWYSDKLVIGNNDHGGHDFALSAPLDSVVMTNPTYYHKSIGLGKNTVIPYAEWGATNASQGFVVIEFPVTAYAMINADIGVYEYNGYNGSNILVGGHPWNGGWYNYGSKTLGELGKQIRFAYTAAGKYAIVIGMPDTTWTYGQVQLKRIQNGTYYDGRVSANGDYSIYQSQDEGIFAWISDDTSRSIDVNRAAQADNAETLDGIDSGAFLRSNTDDDVTGNTEWQDNKQIRLGNSADFRMWHDGSHTYLRNYNHGNGNIYFQGEDTAGANHALLYMFTANTRPYVSLYEDGGERFKTTSAGVEVLGDAYINQGRIHIKRGTGLTHTEWEDDSSANGRAQLILDSHYSDLIIASRNANNNKHGSTLTFATQSTSTNDVAKWVIGQGQYQEGANIMAFSYGVNQTNPHSILGTDNANAEMLITNGNGVWSRNGFASNEFRVNGTTNSGRLYSDSWGMKIGTSSGHIQFGPANNDWAHIYTDRPAFYFNKALYENGARLATQSYASSLAGEVNTRIDNDIRPAIETAQSTADGAVTTANSALTTAQTAETRANSAREEAGAAYALADGKLGATAKAADANKLDGYDWMQSGKNIRASEFYADGWLRNYNSGKGLYNQATGQHFYSDDDDYWNVAGGTGANGIRFRDEHAGTIRGYVVANNSSEVGFLDAGGSWAVKHSNDNGTRFYTDGGTLEFSVGRDTVGASFGTVRTHSTLNGYGGYSIAGRVVFMHDHSNACGIYNDVNNEWMTIWRLNGSTELMHNGSKKLETTSGGATVTGTMTATSFAGDGAGLTGVPAAIPFTTVTGEATACVSMNFDGRAMVFTMADGTSYSIDGARPNQ